MLCVSRLLGFRGLGWGSKRVYYLSRGGGGGGGGGGGVGKISGETRVVLKILLNQPLPPPPDNK